MNKDKLVLAVDVSDYESAMKLVRQLKDDVGVFKIGKELFTSVGPKIIQDIQSLGGDVFLDLKFHDIPNTVEGACRAAANLGVKILNVHASGGKEMMQAAVNGVKTSKNPDAILLAVTVLTSITENVLKEDLNINISLKDQVKHLALLAKEAGCDGVVSSPLEIDLVRQNCGQQFVILTPGVRPSWAAQGDQKRVMTPKEAVQKGADYIVVGRPITQSEKPQDAAKKILAEMS